MPKKPTPASVTSIRCRCPWLKNAAEDPAVPVTFDEEFGEYQVKTRNGGYLVIRHCPWCGGAAPSQRASRFAKVSGAERRRLRQLTANLKTVEDALASLGEPNERHRQGLTVHTPARGRRAARVETFPTMTFSKLSKVADVTLDDYGPKGIGFTFIPKYIGKRRARPRERQKSRRACR